ncbi:glyoxylate carboligase [Salmonella enterica subsp. enterica]|nr:glyoxylate carboligase [Salmonella enterica subsp. enterica]
MGWGCIPDDHPLMAGDGRPANGAPLRQRHSAGIRLWFLASVTVSPTVIRGPLRNILRGEKSSISILNQRKLAACCARIWASFLTPKQRYVADRCRAGDAKSGAFCHAGRPGWTNASSVNGLCWRKTHFDNVPVKPQRVYEEMNKAFGRDVCYVTTIGLSQIAAAQMLHVFKDRHWINCGQAGLLAGQSRRH